MTGRVVAPRSLPLADIAERFRRDDFALSVADRAEYGEVEALARAADPHEVFAPLTAELLSWFIEGNPSGPGFLVLARSPRDGRLAGHFLFYRTTLVRTTGGVDAEVPASLYVHLYVSPADRRKGVFAAMFAYGLEVLVRMGVPFAYTVPNPRSSPGFVKFGVPLLGTLPCRMAPSWPVWQAIPALMAGGRVDVAAERAHGFDASMIPGGRGEAAVRGLRTPDVLNWRFVQRPATEYAIWRVTGAEGAAGYVVTRVVQIRRYRVLVIGDLALARFDAARVRAVLADVRRQSASEPADVMMLQGGSPEPAATRALWRSGLLRVPDRLLPQPVAVFGGAPGERGSTAGFPLLDRWLLTPCDWDVF